VVVLPSLDVRLARDAERTGRQHTGATGVQCGSSYDWNAWRADQWAVLIDNSALSIEQTVARIDEELQERTAGYSSRLSEGLGARYGTAR